MKRIVSLLFLISGLFFMTGCQFLDSFFEDTDEPFEDTVVQTYTLDVSSNLNEVSITINPSKANYFEGDSVAIEAGVVEDYRFSHWIDLDSGARLSTQNPYTFEIGKNLRIQAIYYDLSFLDIQLSSNISVDLEISQDAPYVSMMLYTITADSKSGYRFEHWIDIDTGLIVAYQPTYSFTLNRNRSFKAIYIEDTDNALYLYSNIDVAFDSTIAETYLINATVIVNAPLKDNYEFVHWYDYRNDVILGSNKELTLTMNQSYHIVAVYRFEDDPKLYYFETFEEVSKGNYSSGEVQFYGVKWWFEDTLIGTLANDQKTGTRSVRIRDGYIETLFDTRNVQRIEFDYGKYLSDQDGTLEVYFSFNNQDWVLIDTLTTTSSFENYRLVFNETFYNTYGINRDTNIAFRFVSPGTNRTNFDDFKIYRYHFFTPEIPEISASGDDLEFPNNSTRVTLQFDEDFLLAYSYGDVWTGDGCLGIDEILGEIACQIEGNVNTNALGEYSVTYYVLDEDGQYASETITKVVLRDASLLDFNYSSYYHGIEGLYGDALIEALRFILNDGVALQNYDSARQILELADVDPSNVNRVLTIYDRQSVQGEWDATTWHREHVWPNSRLGIPRVTGSQRNIGSDLHNLRAIIPSINSSRSNKVFSGETTSDAFYPGEDDKGDVARILFYMVVMWDHLKLKDEVLPNNPDTNYTLDGAQMSLLSYLIRWHFDDAVDNFEVHRNEVIYSYQNNRNPFIDYPHLVELIWYDHYELPLE